MNDLRPKNLNLFTIRFPIPALVSILHRATGFILFLLIPLLLFALSTSLDVEGFERLQHYTANGWIRFFIWLFLMPYCFHLVAGIRHLLSDFHIGDTLRAGRITAMLTFIISFLLIVLAGIWLW